MNWERLFSARILERGYDYYLCNAVKNMEVTEDSITADVLGTENYQVEITLEEGEILDMYCSCPYAEDGKNCKHMAAVLYEWTEGDDQGIYPDREELTTKKSGAKEEIRKLIQETEPEIVEEFLADLLMQDEQLMLRFKRTAGKNLSEEDIERYFHQVDEITWRYQGRDGFINYYEADGFILELQQILMNDVRTMINQKNYKCAFRLMNYIFETIGEVDMDDSDGGTGMLADEIYNDWRELLDYVDEKEKHEMFDWFSAHLNGSVIDYLEEYIYQIVLNEFPEKEYQPLKLKFIEKKIKNAASKEKSWSRDYELGRWVVPYLDLLKKQKDGEEKRESFFWQYWDNSSVRRYYIDQCMKKRDYEKALGALDDSIYFDQSYRGLVIEYEQMKKNIYQIQDRKQEYEAQLWKLETEVIPGSLETFKELKKLYSKEEWISRREEIFQKLPPRSNIERLYKEEKLYDRLLNCVVNSHGMFALQEYGGILQKEYPEEILQKYRTEVEKMAVRTSDRKTYQYLVSLLRTMKKMKGGSKVVEQIVIDWRQRYRNRRAMMDELNRL